MRARHSRVCAAAEIGDVLDAGRDAGDALVVERAPLPAVWNGVSERTNLVGTQALQVFALAEENSDVGAEEFVGGADEKVAVERGDIDQAVRAVVHGIDVGERSGGVGEADDLFDGIDGADRVRGVADRDQFGFGAELRREVFDVERAVVLREFLPNESSRLFFEREPWGETLAS